MVAGMAIQNLTPDQLQGQVNIPVADELGGGGGDSTNAGGSGGSNPLSGLYGDLEFRGTVSQLDGTPVVRYEKDGKKQQTTLAAMQRTLERMMEDGELTEDQMRQYMQGQGVQATRGRDGKIQYGRITYKDADGNEQEFGKNSNGSYAKPGQGDAIPGGQAGVSRGGDGGTSSGAQGGSSGSSGSGAGGSGGASGGTSGGGSGGGSGGSSGSGGGGGSGGLNVDPDELFGGSSTEETGGGRTLGAGGTDGPPPIDPNNPLGIDFSPVNNQPGLSQADQRYSDPTVFGRPDSFTKNLDEDATLNDILLGAMGEQRANRDAALNIQGGLATSFEGNQLRQLAEANALELGQNPYSLDDQTIQRMMGQQGELIGRNAERLKQASADQAAARGITRSGTAQADQDRIGINAINQLGNAQRGLLVEQATRRPQELAQANAAVNETLQQQQAARERIAGGATGILRDTNVTADAAVLGSLQNGGTPQIGYNPSGQHGAFGSVSYAGPARFNPFN